MSNEALTFTAKLDVKPSGRKFVLMALANYADEDFSCFPSIAHLARYTSQGEKTIRDHLNALEEEGYITRDRLRYDDGRLGSYRFSIQRRDFPVAELTSGEKQPKPAAKSAAHIHKNIHQRESNKRNAEISLIPDDQEQTKTPLKILSDVLGLDLARDVIEHRRAIKKPLSSGAAKLLGKKFVDAHQEGFDLRLCVETMISKCWVGFTAEYMRNLRSPQRAQGGNNPPVPPQARAGKETASSRLAKLKATPSDDGSSKQLGFDHD